MRRVRVIAPSISAHARARRQFGLRGGATGLVGALMLSTLAAGGCASITPAGPAGAAIAGRTQWTTRDAHGLTKVPFEATYDAWDTARGAGDTASSASDSEAATEPNRGRSGRVLTYNRISVGEPDAWLVERGVDGALIRRELVASTDPDQPPVTLAIRELFNADDNVTVVFDPPLISVPGEMSVGTPAKQRLRMTVHPGEDRSKVRAEGPAKCTVELVGWERLHTPAGTFDAAHLRSTLVASLSGSEVRSVTDLWISPPSGLIAEVRADRTTVLGVPIRESRSAWILAKKPKAD